MVVCMRYSKNKQTNNPLKEALSIYLRVLAYILTPPR